MHSGPMRNATIFEQQMDTPIHQIGTSPAVLTVLMVLAFVLAGRQ
jgi:hypothetical protein